LLLRPFSTEALPVRVPVPRVSRIRTLRALLCADRHAQVGVALLAVTRLGLDDTGPVNPAAAVISGFG